MISLQQIIMFGRPQQGGQNSAPPEGLAKGLGGLMNKNQGNNPKQNQNQGQNQNKNPPLAANQNTQQSPSFLNELGGAIGKNLKPNQYSEHSIMECPRHHQQYVQYCISDHQPMCQNCIGEHAQLHQKALKTQMNFIPFAKALDQVKDKFAGIREKIIGEMKLMDKQDINSHLQDMVQRVIVSKKLMIGEVNKIAESRLKDIQNIQTKYRKVQFLKPFNEAGAIINNYIDALHGPERVEKIQHASLFDEAEFMATFHRTIKENNSQLMKSKCDIIYDKIQFGKMLQKCFYLSVPVYALTAEDEENQDQKEKKEKEKKIFERFQNNINKAAEEERDMKLQYMRELIHKDEIYNKPRPSTLEQEKKEIIEKEINRKKQAELIPRDVEEVLAPKKPLNLTKEKLPIQPQYQFNYVHYFETGSKKLHLYNLNEGVQQTRVLKCDTIPYYHKSVQTSDSSLFLSGGKQTTDKLSKRNQQLWIYSISKDMFRLAPQILKPRSSHTLVEHKRFLYIIGGFNQTNFERDVERFDLPDAKTLSFRTPSFYAGECISASVGDYIWKISMDGIEIYHAESDRWAFVAVKDFKYFESSICACIGPDEIFVFGGYDQSERGVKNTYVIKAVKPIKKLQQCDSQTFLIDKWNKYMLTDPQGFSDNTVAMNNNNIYCWINDSNEFNQVRTDKKTLITFDSYEWRYVPVQKIERS